MTALERKVERIVRRKRPRVLDLFSGCGGLSLGLESAGFEIVAAVEHDREAAETYARNLGNSSKGALLVERDVRSTRPSGLAHRGDGHTCGADAIDVVVGGLPCQAFARVGRAKLREIRSAPQAWHLDERATLYEHFLRFVADLRPLAVLLENVPDILTYRARDIPGSVAEELDALGYTVRYTLLNACHYGVPQLRERFFLMALRKELDVVPAFPAPTRSCELPPGYRDIRAWLREASLDAAVSAHIPPPEAADGLLPAVTCAQALDDLPSITGHLEGELRPGMRAQRRALAYAPRRPHRYGSLMRSWPGMLCSAHVTEHVIRITPRDYEIFRRMRSGDQYPRARQIAEEIFQETLELMRNDGRRITRRTRAWRDLRQATVPPYDDSKFSAKWQKLDAYRPAHTLTAHLGRDCYSHIHHDDAQARTISVREAARLQSFPDSFRFQCSINTALRQIGNAVPPLLAHAVGQTMLKLLRGSRQPERITDLVHRARVAGFDF